MNNAQAETTVIHGYLQKNNKQTKAATHMKSDARNTVGRFPGVNVSLNQKLTPSSAKATNIMTRLNTVIWLLLRNARSWIQNPTGKTLAILQPDSDRSCARLC